MKVLNLYAGIGGNRKQWDQVANVNVTAVEWDEDKANIYRDYFPGDEVIVTDAHEYLLNHLQEFDFIWSSPPCPTHGTMEMINHTQYEPRYPDMDLYQEIVLLKTHADRLGLDYVVENVQSYYDPLIVPQSRARHYFWSNFHIPEFELPPQGISSSFPDRDAEFDYDEHEKKMGYDLSKYDYTKSKKGKMLRNCVNPELGKHILKAATTNRQSTLTNIKN